MTPVSPSATTSGTEPLRQATTGVRQAMASVITSPNGSAHWAGDPAVEHVRLLGEGPVQGVDGRAVAEGADADPDRPGVVAASEPRGARSPERPPGPASWRSVKGS